MLKDLKTAKEQSLMTGSAKAIESVTKLLQTKAINIKDNTVYLYPELWADEEKARIWMKNLHLYCRLTDNLPLGMTLYFKNIETGKLLGFYQDERATIMSNE